MTTHVLVPIDGSPQANAALVYASDLFSDATITLLHVVDPIAGGEDTADDSTSDPHLETQHERALRLFEAARSHLEDDDVTLETAVVTGSPWREIVSYVDAHDVDHVVMGSHGRDGATRLLLGSVAELVVRRASVPVTVVK